MFDLIIVGAGPAGATLARLLGQNRSVLLVDARLAGNGLLSREKCCGGLLAPDAQMQLRRLDLALPDAVRDTGQPLAVRALDLVSGQSRRYPRAYINLDRSAFENWLLSLLPGGVALCGGRYAGAEALPGQTGWRVRLAEPEGERFEQGRALVSAEGANSLIRRMLGAAARPEIAYLAVQYSFAVPAGQNGIFPNSEPAGREYLAFFHPGLTDFYGWIIPKHNETLFGLALPPGPRPAGTVDRLMREAAQALRRFGHDLPVGGNRRGCALLRPAPGDVFLGRDNAWCIGEAAGWISPSSAEGISYAFASAQALAKAMEAHSRPDRILAAYKRNTRSLLANIAWKRVKSAIMFSPAARRLVMASGLLSG